MAPVVAYQKIPSFAATPTATSAPIATTWLASAIGQSLRQSGLSLHAATTRREAMATAKARVKETVSVPLGIARSRVRGFSASIFASAARLNAMAAERAATMATRIHTSFSHGG